MNFNQNDLENATIEELSVFLKQAIEQKNERNVKRVIHSFKSNKEFYAINSIKYRLLVNDAEQLLKNSFKLLLSKSEVINKLKREGCLCSNSPISATSIRVSFKGDVICKIKEILPDAYCTDLSMNEDGIQTVDLWEW